MTINDKHSQSTNFVPKFFMDKQLVIVLCMHCGRIMVIS